MRGWRIIVSLVASAVRVRVGEGGEKGDGWLIGLDYGACSCVVPGGYHQICDPNERGTPTGSVAVSSRVVHRDGEGDLCCERAEGSLCWVRSFFSALILPSIS